MQGPIVVSGFVMSVIVLSQLWDILASIFVLNVLRIKLILLNFWGGVDIIDQDWTISSGLLLNRTALLFSPPKNLVLLLPLLHSAGPSILSHRKFIDSITFLLQAIGLFRHPLNSVVVGTIGTKCKILVEYSCIFEQAWPIHSHMEPLVFSTRQ